jgi:sugar lactone lactonase YvrE
VADSNDVFSFTPPSTTRTTYASVLGTATGLAFDGTTLLVADDDYGIAQVAPDSHAVSTFVPGFDCPGYPVFDAAGNLYVPNACNGTVSKLTPGGVISVFASGLDGPQGLAFGPDRDLYVASSYNDTVERVSPDGTVSTFVPASGGLDVPWALAFDAAGNLYVTNRSSANSVSKVTPGGTVSTFSGGFDKPSGLAFDAAGNLYVSSSNTRTIDEIKPDGTEVSPTFVSGIVDAPFGLAFSPSGGLFTGTGGDTVYAVSSAGAVSAFASGFRQPEGITFDAAGDLYTTNFGSNTVAFITAPNAPTGVSAVASDAAATASWSAPSSDGGMPVTGYDVYVGTRPGAESQTPVNLAPITGTSYQLTGLTDGTTYYVTVKAINGIGASAGSAEVSVTPPAHTVTPPGTPTTPVTSQPTVHKPSPATPRLRLINVSAIKHHRLRATLACTAGRVACRGTAVLTSVVSVRHRHRTESVGTAHVTVRAGHRLVLTLALNRVGRSIRTRSGRIIVTVTVRQAANGTSRTVAHRRLTLR